LFVGGGVIAASLAAAPPHGLHVLTCFAPPLVVNGGQLWFPGVNGGCWWLVSAGLDGWRTGGGSSLRLIWAARWRLEIWFHDI